MTGKNSALYAAAAVFAVVSLAHGVRFFRADEIVVGGLAVPVAWSAVLGVVALGLALWMVAAARR